MREEIECIVGARVVGLEHVEGRGYTHAGRHRARLDDGRSVFVKSAVDELSAGWLRTEIAVYTTLSGDFLPVFHGWGEREGLPLIVLEDLGDAHWPPPWRDGDIDGGAEGASPDSRRRRRRTASRDAARRASRTSGARSSATRSRSSPPASCTVTGSTSTSRLFATPPRARRSRATTFCISTCAATTLRSATGARSSWTGTGPVRAMRSSTWSLGRRRCTRKVGLSPMSSSSGRASPSSPRRSPASGPPGSVCRRRRPGRASREGQRAARRRRHVARGHAAPRGSRSREPGLPPALLGPPLPPGGHGGVRGGGRPRPDGYWIEARPGGAPSWGDNTRASRLAHRNGALFMGWAAHGDGCLGFPGESNERLARPPREHVAQARRGVPEGDAPRVLRPRGGGAT